MSLLPCAKGNLSFLNLNGGVLEKSLRDACSARGEETQRSLPTRLNAVASGVTPQASTALGLHHVVVSPPT